jgi:DNA-binding winged helix-turn-helix (wHTH) protein
VFQKGFFSPIEPLSSLPRSLRTMNRFRLGNIVVEPDRNRIVNGRHVSRVTAREMSVLLYLVGNGTRVVSRTELLDGVWRNVVVNDEALTIVISRLRSVLADNPREPRVIETIPKKGYRLMVSPQSLSAADSKPAPPRRANWAWVAFLATLLAAMTVLFAIARSEYARARAVQDGHTQSNVVQP